VDDEPEVPRSRWISAQEDWQRTAEELVAAGWIIDSVDVSFTTQVEGGLPDGERFYLHAKRDTVSVAIGGDDPSAGASWTHHVERPEKGPYWASPLDAAIGLELLRQAADAFWAGEPSAGTW